MKKSVRPLAVSYVIVMLFIMGLISPCSGQEKTEVSSPLPADVNKIVTNSCMPCHSSKGGMLSRTKVNFDEWTQYSADKQKSKSSKIYSEVSKNKMPPKDVRETRPDIIPTASQVEVLKKWKDSF
jgi:uncharacterized membrane protein